MNTNLATTTPLPTDPRTGLTLPLRESLGSQDLAKHRAMVALELEVLAKKMDRFGWDRDRGSASHDRIITDWMDALQDYPLVEVRAACVAAVRDDPKRMPNEGTILRHIERARGAAVQRMRLSPPQEPERQRVDPKVHAELMAEMGYTPKRMDMTNG